MGLISTAYADSHCSHDNCHADPAPAVDFGSSLFVLVALSLFILVGRRINRVR